MLGIIFSNSINLIYLVDETSGGRVIFGVCKVGGVRRDVDHETLKRILCKLKAIEKDYNCIADRFKCILCGNCTEVCRPKALRMDSHYAGPVAAKRTEISIMNPPTAKDKKK